MSVLGICCIFDNMLNCGIRNHRNFQGKTAVEENKFVQHLLTELLNITFFIHIHISLMLKQFIDNASYGKLE